LTSPLPRFLKTSMMALALAGLLTITVARPSFAEDNHAKCQHAIEKAESRLDEAVRHHGEHSPDADARRRDLNAEREKCWSAYHGWWDGHAHQWHSDHDWHD
jgi:hypothetical protein